jgi:hypothetical protein
MSTVQSWSYLEDTDDDAYDAFDGSGVLKDGRSYKVPMRFADRVSRSAHDRFARIHDGNGNSGAALQRPGFRVADSIARDEAWVAYQRYEAAIQNEWRNLRLTEFSSRSASSKENTSNQDKSESYLSGVDDEQVQALQRGGNYELGPRRQNTDPATLIRDHQQRMAALYAERERELQEQWRCGK